MSDLEVGELILSYLRTSVSGSQSALPVVVINRRHVPNDPAALKAYNAAHLATSYFMMKHIKDTNAAFQSTDVENRSMVGA